jgi:hypothetical protein
MAHGFKTAMARAPGIEEVFEGVFPELNTSEARAARCFRVRKWVNFPRFP